MNRASRAGILAAVLSTVAGATLVAATPATAASGIGDCPYPYVCLYDVNSGRKLAQFQDVTSGYQPLTNRMYDVVNTRYDDVVYFRHFSSYVCVKPRIKTSLPAVNGIRISWESTCR